MRIAIIGIAILLSASATPAQAQSQAYYDCLNDCSATRDNRLSAARSEYSYCTTRAEGARSRCTSSAYSAYQSCVFYYIYGGIETEYTCDSDYIQRLNGCYWLLADDLELCNASYTANKNNAEDGYQYCISRCVP